LILTRASNDSNWQFSGTDITLNGNAYSSFVVTGLTAGATDLEILRKAGIDDVTPREEGAWLESLRGKSAYETAVEYGTYRGSYASIKSDTLDSYRDASYWEDYITNNSGGYNTFTITTGTADVGDTVVMRYGGTISSSICCVVGGIKSITTNWSGANIVIDPDNFAVLSDDGTKTDAELWESCNVHGKGTEADWAQKTAYTSEDWQFVLLDGTTVTKKVVIAP
jgi:RNA polymerase subunit RPABC4/transcription elongation factor Spt4